MTLSDAGITRSSQDGLDLVCVEHGGVREVFATLLPLPGDDLSALCLRTRQLLDETASEVLELRAFGPAAAFASLQEEVGRHLGPMDWPLITVDGNSCAGELLAQARGKLLRVNSDNATVVENVEILEQDPETGNELL